MDSDFYKFTMGQLVFKKYRDVPVKYLLVNRTKGVRLNDFIKTEDLHRELSAVRQIRFDNSDLHYLRGTNEYGERMFSEDYLQFLKELRLPPYALTWKDGNFELAFCGSWAEAIYWEVFALAIVNELYCRALMEKLSPFGRDVVLAQGTKNLADKIALFRGQTDIAFTDFGTRRRFSREWQGYVVKSLSQEFPETQFRGTSNVYLARKYGLVPMGTSAHEMFMVMSGIMRGSDEKIRASHGQVLKDWWEEYGRGLSVALTDTYGSDFFFRDFSAEQAKNWKGLRQDSGDPIAFGEKAIAFYKNHGIDPREKIIVFSDGLTPEVILKIADHFSGRINVTFGWGTNLTNDLGFKSLSLVVKAVEANGYGLVKLSDNVAKAIGNQEDVLRFIQIFGYNGNFSQECKY